MIEINRKLISELFDKALLNPRFRQNYDLRNPDDNGQRMLNALMLEAVAKPPSKNASKLPQK